MRHGGRLTYILVLFFLATQFISIFGTMSVFASPENIGNYEDISPDHIVPLDPFLAGGAAHHACFRNNTNNNNTAALKLFRWLPMFILQSVTLWLIAPIILRCSRRFLLIRYKMPDLWLLHRALLI
ncbi:MAG: hypothetical protein SGJ27_04780 [Candidatus Melainabacteria bacterium]|nr:hypothetical protein [Candidatus Melainabacteria bacterium]